MKKMVDVKYEDARKSSLASFAIEGMKPDNETLDMCDKIHLGLLSHEDAVQRILNKYLANDNV